MKSKKKLKYLIIKEYVQIMISNNFCDLFLCATDANSKLFAKLQSLKEFSTQLTTIIEKIMFKFDLIDISFAILKKQMLLSFKPSTFLQTKDENLIELETQQLSNTIQKNSQNLKILIKKMKLNVFELNYLNFDKLVNF